MIASGYLIMRLCYRFLGLRISIPIFPCASSLSAITVGLSREASTNGADPMASCLARTVATKVMSNRLGILFKQSSTVILAMFFIF